MGDAKIRDDITALRRDGRAARPKTLVASHTRGGMDRRSFLLGLGATVGVAGAEHALFVHRLTFSAATFDFGLRCNDLGREVGQFTELSALEPRERRVVEAAVDGAYETDTASEWLRRLVDGTDYVRDGGRFYALDSTLPTYVVEPTVVDPASVDGAVASRERYRSVRETEYGISCAVTCETSDGEFRTTRSVWLRPDLETFLQEYQYVE
jgi:hypothetical protein